jgi:hypothetical protein
MKQPITLKQAFNQVVNEYNLQNNLIETMIKEVWRQTVGEYVTNATINIKYNNNKLIVHVRQNIKQELMYAKNEIIDKLNEKQKQVKINEIQFI